MLDFIDSLREKPEGTRKKIAHLTSAGFTVIIFFFWVLSFYAHNNGGNLAQDGKDVSPFGALKSSVANVFEGWSSFRSGKNETFTNTIEVEADPGSISKPPAKSTPAETGTYRWEAE